MSEAIKPCPFCGVVPDLRNGSYHRRIDCLNEFCPTTAFVTALSDEMAIARWNTRAEVKP